MLKSKKTYTTEEALQKMAALCSRAEQCESEIVKKLIKMGLSSSQRAEIIDYLKSERYIDNSRYARSFARDKARFSAWGPMKITSSLRLLRISSEHIRDAIESVEPEIWEEGVIKAAKVKSKNLDLIGEDKHKERAKLYRYLTGRGFKSDMALKAVKEICRLQKMEAGENDS